MEIIIIGAGLVGTSLAKSLSSVGHNVVVIDHDASVIKRLQESMDLQALCGDAADGELLRGAGLEKADLILAVTNSDETNIIITMMARAYNATAKIVARVRKKQFLDSPGLARGGTLGGAMVFSPDHAAVDMVLDLLHVDQAFEVVPFSNGIVRIAGFRLGVDSPLVGRPLCENRDLARVGALIVAVDKGEEVVIPNGRSTLSATDRVLITTGAKTELTQILPLLGRQPVKHRKIVIAGGGWKGEQVAIAVEKRGIPVVMMEKSPERCRELAEHLDQTDVMHCDATDLQAIRQMAGGASTFIGMTGHQEVNLVLCLMARKSGARRTIALMDNDAYLGMAPSLGIDAVVSPKLAAVGKIMRFLSVGKVVDAATVLNGRLDAVFVELMENSRIVGAPLKSLGLPRDLIIAAAVKEGQMAVPNGDFVFAPGDQALFITNPGYFHKINEYLGRP